MRKSLTKAELKIIADLLDLAAIDFSKSECDEYILPPWEENKEILIKALEETEPFTFDSDVEEILFEKDELVSDTVRLMEYFAKRCQKLAR